jgi:hypothetical protein
MLNIIKVLLDFIHLGIGAKIAFYRNIVACLTGNAAFINPTVAPPAFAAQIDLVETKADAVAAAKTALSSAEWELEQETAKLDTMGRSLADYVEGASMGNPATLESSGFQLAPPRQPVGVLPAPSNLRALPGQEKTCELRWDRGRGVQSWVAECAPAPEGPWSEIYKGTRARCTATNLTSGTPYWFRVQAIGAAGPSDWSAPTTKRAS